MSRLSRLCVRGLSHSACSEREWATATTMRTCFHSYLCVCCFLWQEWTVKRKGKENPCWTDSSWMDLAPGNYCVKIQKAKPPLRHALFNISMEVFMWWLSVYRCFSWHRSINRIRFGAWASEAMLNYLWRRPHKWMGRLLIKRFNVT